MNKSLYTTLIFFFSIISLSAQPIKKSTILIANPENISLRDSYSIDNVAWGFLPFGGLNDESKMADYLSNVQSIQNEGRVFHARIEFDACWKNFVNYCADNQIEYVDHACVGVDGVAFQYPWFQGSTFNDGKPYWISSHSQVFNDFLKHQIDKILEAKVEVFMIDAQTSSALASRDRWNPGDFSTHGMTAFTAYLKANYTEQELLYMGIAVIDSFNYRTFLNDGGINTIPQYESAINAKTLPLYEEFRLFQNKSIGALTKEMIDYVRAAAPNEIVAGTSSPVLDPFRSTNIAEVDFFQQELKHVMNQWSFEPVLSYKFAEYMSKIFVLTADPGDWKDARNGAVSEEEIKGWISTAYANGANFIAPARQWAYGSDWFTPESDMTYIFDFIKTNPIYFDDQVATASKVAIINSREAMRKYVYDVNGIIHAMEDNNIYYDLIVAGDEYYTAPPTLEEMNQYEKILVAQNEYNWYLSKDEGWKSAIESLGDKVIFWDKNNSSDLLAPVKNTLTKSITITGEDENALDKVIAFPRQAANGSYKIHLINKDLDESTNTYIEKSGFKISLKGDWGNQTFAVAQFTQPGKPAQSVNITTTEDGIDIESIDELNFWGILDLSFEGAIKPVTGFLISPALLNLIVDESRPINATIEPSNATIRSVSWISSDESIAMISKFGVVTGIAPGNATITASTDNGDFTSEIEVKVQALLNAHTPISLENAVIYPNPAQSSVTIAGLRYGPYELSMISLEGKTILSESIHVTSTSYELDLENVKPGLYVIRISNQENQLQKLLKIKR